MYFLRIDFRLYYSLIHLRLSLGLMLNNRRKYLYTLTYFSQFCFSSRSKCIFEIKLILLLFKYFDFFIMIDN